MTIAIIQYNAGNTCSVSFALQRLGITPVVTADPGTIMRADKVILPGVGAAGAAMQNLQTTQLEKLIPSLQKPVLGICLGMQLMCAYSEEDETKGLGIFPQTVEKFRGKEKVPHTGWNNISGLGTALFAGISDGAFMYFVHSYYAPVIPETIAHTDYIAPFSAAVQKDNFYGVQFHPEKSGVAGNRLLENFLAL